MDDFSPGGPVIAVGRINVPLDAADILTLGHADMVAMTRQQIADPETVNKMADGRLDEIRRCIGCNQGCIDRLFNVTHSSCVHNTAAGYGRELGIGTLVQARFRRRIVVVGAGPAGMRAAETAARLAHEVILIERRTRTGGQRRIAAKMAGRGEIAGAVDHLDVMIGKIRGRPSVISGVDTVVLAGWHRPVSDLYFALKGEGTSVERVGDAIASRTMMEAVHEGERAARRIPAYALT